jgi:DNA-binding protein HU-beta/integration host factor subunit alpha
MTKRELATAISQETHIPFEDVQAILQKILDRITEALVKGDHIEFRDFGVFEIRTRKPRVGRNPRKPEQVVQIPARKVVKFKAGREMKKRVLAS